MHGDNIKEYEIRKERLGYLCISVVVKRALLLVIRASNIIELHSRV